MILLTLRTDILSYPRREQQDSRQPAANRKEKEEARKNEDW
jgi:hypothetical protein